jgi:hypothetical protein
MKTKAQGFIPSALAAAVLGYGSALDARVMRAESIMPRNSALLHHGQIALANDTLFQQGNVDIELTEYAVGYRDPSDLEGELNTVAPAVQTPERFSYRAFENSEAFLLDTGDNDIREIGGNFNELEDLHSSETETRTLNKGFAMRIDRDRVANQPNWQQRYVGHIRTRLLRCDVRRAYALLTAAAVNTDKTWGSSADPDMDLANQIKSSGDISGIQPNTLVMDEAAWLIRMASHRAQNTAGSNASASMSFDQLRQQLGLPRGYKTSSRYQSSSSAKSLFLSSKVLIYTAIDGAMEDDASNIKTFWSPCENGQRFQVWIAEFPKYYLIMVEHYSRPTLTSSLGIRKLTISAS